MKSIHKADGGLFSKSVCWAEAKKSDILKSGILN